MKRIWSALVCFVLAVALCIFEVVYTTNGTDEVYNMITMARQEFNSGKGDTKKSVEMLIKAKEIWSEKECVMNIFLYHDRIDDVATKIDCAKSLAENNDIMAEIEIIDALSTLSTMKRLEFPIIENIL